MHGMHRGHVRSHVTYSIVRFRYLHLAHLFVRIVPDPRDGLPYSPGAKPPGKESSMLVLSRRLGERIVIGDRIVVTVVKLDHGQVRLGIEAPREIAVFREEIAPHLHPLPPVPPIV
jgi:carbon storage regulator